MGQIESYAFFEPELSELFVSEISRADFFE